MIIKESDLFSVWWEQWNSIGIRQPSRRNEYGQGIVAAEDDSGDENTKVKDDNNVAEEDNCVRWGRG